LSLKEGEEKKMQPTLKDEFLFYLVLFSLTTAINLHYIQRTNGTRTTTVHHTNSTPLTITKMTTFVKHHLLLYLA